MMKEIYFSRKTRPDIPDNQTMMAGLSTDELFLIYQRYLSEMQRAFDDNDLDKVLRFQTIMIDLGRELTKRKIRSDDCGVRTA